MKDYVRCKKCGLIIDISYWRKKFIYSKDKHQKYTCPKCISKVIEFGE